jgi:hypothetical protein
LRERHRSLTSRAPFFFSSLAILKVNGPALLQTTDDGAFIKCVSHLRYQD